MSYRRLRLLFVLLFFLFVQAIAVDFHFVLLYLHTGDWWLLWMFVCLCSLHCIIQCDSHWVEFAWIVRLSLWSVLYYTTCSSLDERLWCSFNSVVCIVVYNATLTGWKIWMFVWLCGLLYYTIPTYKIWLACTIHMRPYISSIIRDSEGKYYMNKPVVSMRLKSAHCWLDRQCKK